MIALPPPPPQVLVAVCYTCPNCNGSEYFVDETDGTCSCHLCINGLLSVLVPWAELAALTHTLPAAELHAAMVALAKDCRARQPALLYNTSALPIGALPTKPRIPLQRIAEKRPEAA